ncbi:MAG: sialate O-acetylesterase, partial [Thermoguttaceae bacterium]|nr:sialate O-acetylesterase [Thermoguttaceae bacterium]
PFSLVRSTVVSASVFAFFTVFTLGDVRVASAAVRLPRVFGSGMVLQRDATVPVWGWGDVGEKVTVEIAGEKQSTSVGADGRWRVDLSPKPAGGPFELKVSATNKVVFKDVLFGDVWICAGQSNMGFSLRRAKDADAEIATANYPNLRFLTVPTKSATEPQTDFNATWAACSPKTARDFSAVAYFFGRRLRETIQVPVGLIEVAWGGASCEAWIEPRLLVEHPELSGLASPARLEKTPENQRVGALRNGMLEPLKPFAIKGVVWYQGEANAGRAWQYRLLFPIAVESWRQDWEHGDFPFYFVQLANFMAPRPQPGNSSWAELREAQSQAARQLRNVGCAVAIDVGETADVHPKDKKPVGERLALLALARTYGVDVVCAGPEFRSMKIDGNRVVLTFDNTDGGLKIGANAQCDDAELRGFAVAGADRKFYWANAEIDGETVVVSAPEVERPVAVRYAWADNPICNLTNGAGLPASPFRSDVWPGVTVDAR